MLRSAPFIILIFISSSAFSQDSLVRYKELAFSSPTEQDVFDRFKRHDVDLFDVMMANGKVSTEAQIKEYKSQFYKFLDDIDYEKSAKTNPKRLKILIDKIEKRYLLRYDLQGYFEDIFSNGTFNGYTAVALYSLALERLKISYVVKEESARVYVVVYPADDKIMVSPIPNGADYFKMSDAFKKEYVKSLEKRKVIPVSEFSRNTDDQLFDTYYFERDNNLTLPQLAAALYVQEGLGKWQKSKEAFTLFEKSYFLFPASRTAYLMLYSGAQFSANYNKSDSVHAVLINKLSRYRQYGIERDNIIAELANASQRLLSDQSDEAAFEQYYRVLTRDMDDVQLKSDLSFLYHYERGRYLYNKGKNKNAMPFLEKAIAEKPTEIDAQTLLLHSFARYYQSKSNLELISACEDFARRYEGLTTNDNFNSMLANAYLMEFYKSYNSGKPVDGDKYKKLFENLASKYPDLSVNQNAVGEAYSAAAVYYFRKGQKPKAKQFLEDGLKHAPNSYELLSRKEMIR